MLRRQPAKRRADIWRVPDNVEREPGMLILSQSMVGMTEFDGAVAESFAGDDSYVIEVKTDRRENVVVHQELWNAVRDAIAGVRA